MLIECERKDIEYPFNDSYVNVSVLYAFMNCLSLGTGMEKALAEYGMEFEGTQHRAKDDAFNLGRLVLKMFGE